MCIFLVGSLNIKLFRITPQKFNSEEPIPSYVILGKTNGTVICERGEWEDDPRICSDGVGGAIIAWDDDKIFAQRIDSYGNIQWILNGIAVSQSLNSIASPDICEDGDGGAIITWHGGIVWTDHNIYARKINSTGHLQWSIKSICTAPGSQATPQICSDGSGGAIIVWRDYRSGPDPSHELCDVYVQRVNSTGNTQWASNGILISDSNHYMNSGGVHPKIISDGERGAIIVWEDRRNGSNNIYAQRINSSGDIQWTPNGVAVCEAPDTQTLPVMCSDGLGGVIFTWVDNRDYFSLYPDIYAQRVNSTGDIQWNLDGNPICKLEEFQTYAQICTDGEGGAIIAWRDERNDNVTIYTQKINTKGEVLWDLNGKKIADPAYLYYQYDPKICSDNMGGAIISWVESGPSQPNITINVQHIDSEGRLNWFKNGLIVRNLSGSVHELQLCNDVYGNALMTWRDFRRDQYDIYAQIIVNMDDSPTSNSPDDIITALNSPESIEWVLNDDIGEGAYRVLVNNSDENFYVLVDWASWENDTSIVIPVNTSFSGLFCYKIEYFDNESQLGIPDLVLVSVEPPEQPNDPDDPNNRVISFGFYYLIYIVISLSLVIIILRRKIFYDKIRAKY